MGGEIMFKLLKKTALLSLAVILASGSMAAVADAGVTEKVEAMIAENSPLKVKDNDLWLMIGGPLVFGIQYDKYATGQVAIGGGAGTFLDGFSLDLGVKYYFSTGKFSPFISGGGVFYYTGPRKNIFAVDVVAGLSYFFDSGMGLSLGFAYVKSISESEEPFSCNYINDAISWPSPQFGFHWNY